MAAKRPDDCASLSGCAGSEEAVVVGSLEFARLFYEDPCDLDTQFRTYRDPVETVYLELDVRSVANCGIFDFIELTFADFGKTNKKASGDGFYSCVEVAHIVVIELA